MNGNLHGKIGIERLEHSRVIGVIDVIEPHAFGQRLMQHRRVVSVVDRSESRSKGTDTRIAINLQVKNFDGEGISGLGTLDVKRARERIVAFCHAEPVAGFLDGVAETVERVGVENVTGVQPSNRLSRGEKPLYIAVGGGVVNNARADRIAKTMRMKKESKARTTSSKAAV
jgi:hypothetical protein